MKKAAILFAVMLFLTAQARATLYDADWLERGCTNMTTYNPQKRDMTPEKLFSITTMTTWLQGFLSGIRVGGSLANGSPSKLNTPPENWSSALVAARVLVFIQRHKSEMQRNSPAEKVMLAWYLTDHPDSTPQDKAKAKQVLKSLSGD